MWLKEFLAIFQLMMMDKSAEERDFFQEFCLQKAPLSPDGREGACFLFFCFVVIWFAGVVFFSSKNHLKTGYFFFLLILYVGSVEHIMSILSGVELLCRILVKIGDNQGVGQRNAFVAMPSLSKWLWEISLSLIME